MDRDAVVEAAVAFAGVGTLAAIIIWIGTTHASNGVLSEDGGLALVAAIAFFIVLMSGIGVGLSRRY